MQCISVIIDGSVEELWDVSICSWKDGQTVNSCYLLIAVAVATMENFEGQFKGNCCKRRRINPGS